MGHKRAKSEAGNGAVCRTDELGRRKSGAPALVYWLLAFLASCWCRTIASKEQIRLSTFFLVRCFLGGLVCADYWRAEESGTLSLGLIRSLLGADNGRAIQSGTLSNGWSEIFFVVCADSRRAEQSGTL